MCQEALDMERSNAEERTESKCRKDKDNNLRYWTGPPAEFRRVSMRCLSHWSGQQQHLLQWLQALGAQEMQWAFNIFNSTLDQFNLILDNFNSILDQLNSILDNFNSILDQLNSILDNFNLILDQFNSILDNFNSILDQLNSILNNFNSILNNFNLILDQFNSILDNFNLILNFHNSILDTRQKETLVANVVTSMVENDLILISVTK